LAVPLILLARSYSLILTSTDYDAWRVGEAPVTVEEVMKTLSANASLSKHVTASILGALNEAIKDGSISSGVKGSMKYSLIGDKSAVRPQEQWKLSYILPEYFKVEEPKQRERSAGRRIDTEDRDDLERGL
jgi:5'-methylthioadenosine phosphorylase